MTPDRGAHGTKASMRERPPLRLLVLAAASLVLLAFLARNRGFLPMWAEGIPEYEGTLLAMVGELPAALPCSVPIGRLRVPLAMTSYAGPGYIYAYLPATWLWFRGIATDPYVYRMTGIVLFLWSAWLFHALLSRLVSPDRALLGALCYLTTPTLLLLSLADGQSAFLPWTIVFSAFLFSLAFTRSGRAGHLFAACFAFGAILLTRVEMLVWLAAGLAVWWLIGKERWRRLAPVFETRGRVLAAVAGFALGSATFVSTNLFCRDLSVFRFVLGRVMPTAEETPFADALRTRLAHFLELGLLNRWPWLEIRTPNIVLAALFFAACVFFVSRVRRARLPFPLVLLGVSIVLSTLVPGEHRLEHLIILQPAVLATVVLASAAADEMHGSRLGPALLCVLLAANVVTTAVDWRAWKRIPPDARAMVNQGAPMLLTSHLLARHPNDQIYFTNFGLRWYVEYMTAGRLQGWDLFYRTPPQSFDRVVRELLANRSERRVFVCVSRSREGHAGAHERTARFYELLAESKAPYSTERLSTARCSDLYDVVVVEGMGATAAPL
jgi:hypothetical protein